MSNHPNWTDSHVAQNGLRTSIVKQFGNNHPNRSTGRIGYDYSRDPNDLRVRCPKHGDKRRGPPLYAGEEWGAHDFPTCEICGTVLDALVLVD